MIGSNQVTSILCRKSWHNIISNGCKECISQWSDIRRSVCQDLIL